jgi:hypothetical protein
LRNWTNQRPSRIRRNCWRSRNSNKLLDQFRGLRQPSCSSTTPTQTYLFREYRLRYQIVMKMLAQRGLNQKNYTLPNRRGWHMQAGATEHFRGQAGDWEWRVLPDRGGVRYLLGQDEPLPVARAIISSH